MYLTKERNYRGTKEIQNSILSNLERKDNYESNYKAIISLKSPLRCFITFHHELMLRMTEATLR